MNGTRNISFVIKICGVTNEEDAQLAIEAGANTLGFNFYRGSPRYVTPARAKEIVEVVQIPFWKVGVFVNATETELAKAAVQVPLDVVQLHGDDCPAHFLGSYRVWRSIGANDATHWENACAKAESAEARSAEARSAEARSAEARSAEARSAEARSAEARSLASSVEAYVLDTPSSYFGGSGKCFDWSLAAAFAYRKIIAGGLDATNVADAIRTAQPWGVDACSRLEASPGKKDRQRVRDFVNAALASRPKEILL